MYRKFLIIGFIITFSLLTYGCNENPPLENQIDYQSYTILNDTIYQTEVHIFKSNLAGPKVAIIGGIHGDEIAGWMAAENLLEKNDFLGEVLIIPRANILATYLEERYPGINNNGKYQKVTYSDLNRCFPGKVDGTISEQIAYIISQEIIEFQPSYIIDLHESRRSYADSKPLIGDEVIYGNKKSALLALKIVEEYNDKYSLDNDIPFIVDSNAPEGSFNYYFGQHTDAYVFTIETNRQLDLSKRIGQQKNLLDVFLKLIWN